MSSLAGIRIEAVDYHTAGEPFRIVVAGVADVLGATMLDKRRFAQEHLDEVRKLLVFEPRGHADMYGCFVTDPVDDDGDLGVLFFHNAGFSTACGHGTIALVTWALETGRLDANGTTPRVIVDAPSGRLETWSVYRDGDVASVRFRNVPSFVFARNIVVTIGGRTITCDISYGGAFYASVDVSLLGLAVTAEHLSELIALGRAIKSAIEATTDIVHPLEPELRDVYGVIFYETLGTDPLTQRNVTIFADGEVDRSPCGSGTSARLALLDDSGELPRGEELVHHSILDTVFTARVSGDIIAADLPAVITEVEGSAYRTGSHVFELEPSDPLGTGFILR